MQIWVKKGTKSSWSEDKKGKLFPRFPVKCEFCFLFLDESQNETYGWLR